MLKNALIKRRRIVVYILIPLGIVACNNQSKGKLQGNWKLKSGETKLKITDKKFSMDSDLEYAEDYFVKADTIFTSFQGNQPYTKYIIKKLSDHDLKLVSPDSAVMEFSR